MSFQVCCRRECDKVCYISQISIGWYEIIKQIWSKYMHKQAHDNSLFIIHNNDV